MASETTCADCGAPKSASLESFRAAPAECARWTADPTAMLFCEMRQRIADLEKIQRLERELAEAKAILSRVGHDMPELHQLGLSEARAYANGLAPSENAAAVLAKAMSELAEAQAGRASDLAIMTAGLGATIGSLRAELAEAKGRVAELEDGVRHFAQCQRLCDGCSELARALLATSPAG